MLKLEFKASFSLESLPRTFDFYIISTYLFISGSLTSTMLEKPGSLSDST